jgi:hypothetical protein
LLKEHFFKEGSTLNGTLQARTVHQPFLRPSNSRYLSAILQQTEAVTQTQMPISSKLRITKPKSNQHRNGASNIHWRSHTYSGHDGQENQLSLIEPTLKNYVSFQVAQSPYSQISAHNKMLRIKYAENSFTPDVQCNTGKSET